MFCFVFLVQYFPSIPQHLKTEAREGKYKTKNVDLSYV